MNRPRWDTYPGVAASTRCVSLAHPGNDTTRMSQANTAVHPNAAGCQPPVHVYTLRRMTIHMA